MIRILAAVLALAVVPGSLVSQEGEVVVDGVPIHYQLEGEGPPLVLIHGWAHNLDVWDLQVPRLSRDFTVLRYDRRGFGESGGHADPTQDPVDLAALMSELELESAAVVGHSQGAAVALAFALEYPDRVDALVLYGAPPPQGFGLPWTGADAIPAELPRIAREQGLDSVGAIVMAHPLAREFEPESPGAEIAQRLWDAYSGDDLIDPRPPLGATPPPHVARLAEIAVPTLVVTGEMEMPYFQVVAAALAYGIPDARRIVVAGGGHAVHLQAPERFTVELLPFLGEATGTVPAAPAAAGARDAAAATGNDSGGGGATRELTDAREEWSRAIAAGDLDAIFSFWTDDVVIYPADRPAVRGIEAVRAYVRENRAERGLVPRSVPVEIMASASGDMGYVVGRFEWVNREGDAVMPGRYVTLWRRNDAGEWRCFLEIHSSEPGGQERGGDREGR